MPASPQIRMGAGLVGAAALITLSTMWFLSPASSAVKLVLIQLVALGVAGVLAFARPNVEAGSRWLLVYPAIILALLMFDSWAAKDVAVAYTGFLMLGFIFVGLTQPRWTSIPLVPIAAVAWLYVQIGPSNLLGVKLVIAVCTWTLTTELLASGTASVRTRLGQLTLAADTDALTGLGNRRSLDAALPSVVDGSVIVLLDLDHFKRVNDTFGHAAGDDMLRDFARTLTAVLRSGDLAFRYGGEEVVVIMPASDGTTRGASSFFDRLRAAWREDGRPTFSAGAAVHRGGLTAQETFYLADQALYEAKQLGRDRFVARAELPRTQEHSPA